MTLQEIINILKKIALTQPNVRTATSGDIYEVMNGNPSVRYGVFHITQNTHQSFDDRDVYGLNLFYVDRNEDDNANTLQIQSVGKTVIDNIVKSFCEEFDGDFPTITYTPFTQRFKDDTAGVFAGLSLEVFKEWTCAEGFGDFITDRVIVRNQSKTIQVTKSGTYVVTPDAGFTGLDKVVVDAELANTVQDVKSIEITENGEYAVVADSPFLSIGKVDIDVNLPLQEKKELTVTDNGTYEVMADEGYVGMRVAEVTFEYEPKKRLPNGMRLSESTFTEFDMTLYDWSLVYDWYRMFSYCGELKHLTTTPNLNLLYVGNMFMDCYLLETLDLSNWDTSKVVDMNYMFRSCHNLRTIEGIEDWDTSKVVDMTSMFENCGLTSLDLSNWDVSKVTNMAYMFSSCYHLVELRMGGKLNENVRTYRIFADTNTTGTFYYPKEYDYSKIIAELPSTWTAVPY